MDFAARDAIVAEMRRTILNTVRVEGEPLMPLRAQAEWQLATEGWTLLDAPPEKGDYYHRILMPSALVGPNSMIIGERDVNEIPCSILLRKIVPREGGAAHVAADLAAFKAGKSFWTGFWAAGFAAIPNVKVQLIALNYANAEMEWNYLTRFLLSPPPDGIGMPYSKFYNDVKGGKMYLKLRAGTEFEVMSWDNKEALKGKQIIAYVYCEAYQLPDLSVYTTLAQNLRQLRGFALFPTTPDRPWVGVLHDYGHGQFADWHCTCCVDANENPYTYDQKARDRDDPSKGGLMTRERFAIAWQGKLGTFIGRVYDFSRGDPAWQFSPEHHPQLWSTETVEQYFASLRSAEP